MTAQNDAPPACPECGGPGCIVSHFSASETGPLDDDLWRCLDCGTLYPVVNEGAE